MQQNIKLSNEMYYTNLIITPHDDDEISCFSVISEKNTSTLVLSFVNKDKSIMSNVAQYYRNEHDTHFYNASIFVDFDYTCHDQELHLIPFKLLTEAISYILREHNFKNVYIPRHDCMNMDHVIVNKAALVATRPLNDDKVYNIFEYASLGSGEYVNGDILFNPNYFREVNIYDKAEFITKYYHDVLNNNIYASFSVNNIIKQNELYGMQILAPAAEGFKIIKLINKFDK